MSAVMSSVLLVSACGASSDKVVTSKAGDITKEEFYTQMKQQAGKQVLPEM
ncbi:peptidylprolyl isomerase PrsA, partial [Bacillus thuringiensis]|nr:peptidylprolyl isomerase PrsA [Bacillus thuringiensis]